MALVIGSCRSGEGKTTVTLALLAYLATQKAKVQSFKVGPDYIDPMFHRAITNRPSPNLDPILTSTTYVQSSFSRHSQDVDYVLVEGVMGLFDGLPLDPCSDFASTAHIARLLNLPALLVIDCSRLSGSVAAIAHGYRSFDPHLSVAGVVLNRVGSDRHLQLLEQALESLQLPILGVLRRQDLITLPDRHLGLVLPSELEFLPAIIDQLAALAAHAFDWSALLPLLAPPSSQTSPELPTSLPPVRIALASDRAFNFYYPDNLELLTNLGAELLPWSPLEDQQIPPAAQALYFPGGYPEVFAETLAANTPAKESVAAAIRRGMPTYAECGGMMYLCEHLIDFQDRYWPMVGIIPTSTVMNGNLSLGYRQAQSLQPSPLLAKGEKIIGHEFHRSSLIKPPPEPLLRMESFASKNYHYDGWQLFNVHASYLHVHFGAQVNFLIRFLTYTLNSL